jgi:PKD repeat protein
MADEKEKSGGGFIKAIMSSAVGLVSGAIIMYVSPLVNSAIKPAKPVPNFSYALEGATATFNNRSTGATQGWWDFGDNSGLEPFAPNQASMAHKFPGPGTFTVKLTLHNLIGEEAERIVSVKVNDQLPPPTIEAFEVTPLSSNRAGTTNLPTAPATFRITGKLKNADLLIWSIDNHPLELVEAAGETIDRCVTFDYYGNMKIRLMAVAGKGKVEKEKVVFVDVPDETPMILVQQHSYAAKVKTIPISVSFPAQFNGPTYPFEVVRDLARDATILEANLDGASDRLVRNPKLVIAADRKSFKVTGELIRQNGAGATTTSWFSKVELKVVNQGALATKQSDPVSAPLKLPGQTLLALPASTGGIVTGLDWELREGMEVAYKDKKVPATQVVRLKDKSYRVTVTQVGAQIQCDAAEMSSIPVLNTSAPRK